MSQLLPCIVRSVARNTTSLILLSSAFTSGTTVFTFFGSGYWSGYYAVPNTRLNVKWNYSVQVYTWVKMVFQMQCLWNFGFTYLHVIKDHSYKYKCSLMIMYTLLENAIVGELQKNLDRARNFPLRKNNKCL